MVYIKKPEARIPDGITAEEWAQASHADRIRFAAHELHNIIIDNTFKSNDVASGLMRSIYDALNAIPTQSHTVEPMAHEWHERFGLTCCKVCGLVRNENSDTKGCRGPVYVSLRDASPVQPVLEWVGDHLEFNGVKIGNLIRAGGGGEQYHSFTVYDCPTKAMRRSGKIAEMEQHARQWLSGGDK